MLVCVSSVVAFFAFGMRSDSSVRLVEVSYSMYYTVCLCWAIVFSVQALHLRREHIVQEGSAHTVINNIFQQCSDSADAAFTDGGAASPPAAAPEPPAPAAETRPASASASAKWRRLKKHQSSGSPALKSTKRLARSSTATSRINLTENKEAVDQEDVLVHALNKADKFLQQTASKWISSQSPDGIKISPLIRGSMGLSLTIPYMFIALFFTTKIPAFFYIFDQLRHISVVLSTGFVFTNLENRARMDWLVFASLPMQAFVSAFMVKELNAARDYSAWSDSNVTLPIILSGTCDLLGSCDSCGGGQYRAADPPICVNDDIPAYFFEPESNSKMDYIEYDLLFAFYFLLGFVLFRCKLCLKRLKPHKKRVIVLSSFNLMVGCTTGVLNISAETISCVWRQYLVLQDEEFVGDMGGGLGSKDNVCSGLQVSERGGSGGGRLERVGTLPLETR